MDKDPTHSSTAAHAVFDVAAAVATLPEACSTMVADHRFVDVPAASARVFRVYSPTPPHSHASCDEYLYVLSGRCMMKFADEPAVEVGPGNVLSGLVKRIDRSVKAISVSNVAGLDKLEETLEAA